VQKGDSLSIHAEVAYIGMRAIRLITNVETTREEVERRIACIISGPKP
jgi:hypothetical protein